MSVERAGAVYDLYTHQYSDTDGRVTHLADIERQILLGLAAYPEGRFNVSTLLYGETNSVTLALTRPRIRALRQKIGEEAIARDLVHLRWNFVPELDLTFNGHPLTTEHILVNQLSPSEFPENGPVPRLDYLHNGYVKAVPTNEDHTFFLEVIPLTDTELRMLGLLAICHHRMVERVAAAAHLGIANGNPKKTDAHINKIISNVRKKTGLSEFELETERGVGYRLNGKIPVTVGGRIIPTHPGMKYRND